MKMNDLKSKTEAELGKLLREKREELRKSRFASAGSKDRNVKRARDSRRTIAQVLTELQLRGLVKPQRSKL